MRTVAVIPIKDKSERVENKNFKFFVKDIPLIEFKIKQLIQSNIFSDIYISSDSTKAEEIAYKYNLKFINRDKFYCNNIIPWSDVIYNVVNSIPENDETSIAWCHTTSPLFTRYKEAVEKYNLLITEDSGYNGLITVSELNEFIIDEKSRPLNYNWGIWHEYSQNMDKLFKVTGALFIARKSEMLKNRYVISRKPFLYKTSFYESIDIDTPLDFKLAQLLYANKEDFKNA